MEEGKKERKIIKERKKKYKVIKEEIEGNKRRNRR